MSIALEGLMPTGRVKVLRVLLTATDPLYVREIARLAGVPLRAVQRELATYLAMDLVSRRPRGREVFLSVRPDHPLVPALRDLFARAAARPEVGAARAADESGARRRRAPQPPEAAGRGSSEVAVSRATSDGAGSREARRGAESRAAREGATPRPADTSWRVW